MKKTPSAANVWLERIFFGLFFIAIGGLIILVFSPWRPLLEREADYLGRAALVAALAGAVILAAKRPVLGRYRPLLLGLLILACAVSLDWVFGKHLLGPVGVTDTTPFGWAMLKLNESVVVILAIVLLNRATGGSLGSIYIQKGNLKLGLTVGLIAFGLAAAGSVPMATLFKAQNLTLARITPWIPWLLIYVLCNGALEELMFRGLFLRKLQPFLGSFMSNFIIAFVFTVLHDSVDYTADTLIFLAVTFPLALVWGYLMQKTDSIWGSILFHAGMDIPIMLGIFSGLA